MPPHSRLPAARGAGNPSDREAGKDPISPPGATARHTYPLKAEDAVDPLIGKTIGRCRIEMLVGVGKTARVYQGRHEALDGLVAVKILRPRVAENQGLVDRFHSEARAIASIDNENVLKIYDVGTEAGQHYMVVELLEGEEILALIRREGQIEVMDALRIIRQATNGLGAAHERELVHRDVKPENLFLLDDGTVKVLDFGLAANFDKNSERVGTPHYMAPEVCQSGAVSPANDIYGLGISLFHLLTGRPPYAGRDRKAIFSAHLAGLALHPERELRGLPKEVADLVRQLTKREPQMRPTAAELLDALDRIGGKELKQKASLGRRRKRSRSRLAVARRDRRGKRVPVLPIAIGIISAVAIGLLALGGQGGGTAERSRVQANVPDDAVSSGSRPQEPRPAKAPEKSVAKNARPEAVEREREASEALERAEAYARKTWRAPADTDAVLLKYTSVWSRHEFTKAGKEARRRALAIKHKKMHPHPDRVLTSESAVAKAQSAWKENRPKVEDLIRKHDYRGARRLVPESVSDAAGDFPRELDFWREHTRLLEDFQSEFINRVTKLPPDKRTLVAADGQATIRRVTPTSFEVRIGGRRESLPWSRVGADVIAELAAVAFGTEDARLVMLSASFAFAHKLGESFWDTQLLLGITHGAEAYDRLKRAYAKRFRAWSEAER